MEVLSSPLLQNENQLNWDSFLSTVIVEVKRGGKVFTSTGVLIDNRALLTAAHSIDCAESVQIILTHDYNFITDTYEVERCYIHPEYNPSQSLYENDIALLFLKEPVTRNVLFDEIPDTIELEKDSVLERIGFGSRASGNCRTWTNPQYLEMNFSKTALKLVDRYSFVGDSGGPIYQNIDGERRLIGLHSTKEAGEYTYVINLASYKSWIDSLIAAVG